MAYRLSWSILEVSSWLTRDHREVSSDFMIPLPDHEADSAGSGAEIADYDTQLGE